MSLVGNLGAKGKQFHLKDPWGASIVEFFIVPTATVPVVIKEPHLFLRRQNLEGQLAHWLIASDVPSLLCSSFIQKHWLETLLAVHGHPQHSTVKNLKFWSFTRIKIQRILNYHGFD